MERCCVFLGLFYHPTLDFSSDSAPLSITSPTLNDLMLLLKKRAEDKGADLDFKEAAEKANNRLATFNALHDDPPYYISTMIDPRLGMDAYAVMEWHDQYQEMAKDALQACYIKYQRHSHIVETRSQPSVHPRRYTSSLSKVFEEVKRRRLSTKASEIDIYLAIPFSKIDTFEDVLQSWKSAEPQFPVLSQIARDFLAVPASSVDVERDFSVAGRTVTDLRNRMKPETLSKLMCLHQWMGFPLDVYEEGDVLFE